MGRYRKVFQRPHVVLPVIHVDSSEQAQRNTLIAREAGADGVFLINHGMPDSSLLDIHDAVAKRHHDWWIGVNCLGMTADETFKTVSPTVTGVWSDNAGIDEGQLDQPMARQIGETQQARVPNCLWFGGVAFKYQRPVTDLEAACQIATQHMDVVTTSGPGTGQAAEIKKIQRMKQALGDTPLAIASGITPENVHDYLPFADCFLVATGISQSFTELDSDRVRSLVVAVRAWHDEQPPDSASPDHRQRTAEADE